MAEPVYNDSGCTGSAPLVLGAARGRRAFYLDAAGVLRGVTYRWPWRDGENVAECMVTKVRNPVNHVPHKWPAIAAPYVMGGVVFQDDPDTAPEPSVGMEWAKCEGMDPTCGCGFYAYHDSTSMYATTGPGCRVQAVVEAYGRVVLGTQGYRAEKARILAVVVPPVTEAARRRVELEKAARDARQCLAVTREVLAKPWWKHTLIGAYLLVAAGAVGSSFVPGWRVGGLLLSGYALANARISYITIKNQLKEIERDLVKDIKACEESLAGLPHDYTEHVERCKERYPSVKFYDNTKAMLEDFPVTSLRHLAIPEGPVPSDAGE